MPGMRGREFISLFGGAAAAWPLAAHSQQPGKLPTIGVLASGTSAVQGRWWAAFAERLHVLGWIEGRTAAIEYRWAENRPERFARDRGRVRPAQGRCHCHIGDRRGRGRQANGIGDPDRLRACGGPRRYRPCRKFGATRGNATGLSLQVTDLGGKRLELLRQVVPAICRLAILSISTIRPPSCR